MTSWTIVHQAPLFMEFFRQEYWSRLPFPSLGDLPDPGVKSALQADSLPSDPPGKPSEIESIKDLKGSLNSLGWLLIGTVRFQNYLCLGREKFQHDIFLSLSLINE